jgi:hypothetical protein
MRKLLLTLLALTFHQLALSQNKNERITIEFKDANRTTVLESIEKSTSFEFFFDAEWFANDKTVISGNYQSISIDDLLGKIFDNTNYNYFVQDNKIILTQNSVVYDTLMPNYFATTTTDNFSGNNDKPNENPIFFQEYDSINTSRTKKSYGIVLIGKDKKTTDKKRYVLSGYVKDAATEKPLSNITVRIQNKNISSVTNGDGYFTMQVPSGINHIETESLNHVKTTKSLMVYDNGRIDLYIKENINDLDEVIVKGKANKNVREAITGVSTIDIEGIKNVPLVLGERDIFRIAATLPGIKTTGEGSAGYNVRGGKDDQNLILVDNAVLYNSSHFLGFFSAVNPYTTSKVDIYKGSIPAQYGGRLSSVFDIMSKKGSQDKLTGEGGIGIVTSNLTISTPIIKDKSSLLVGIRGTYSEWILKSLKNESLQNSQAAFYDGTIKYNHQINKNNTFESTFYYSHDTFNISSDSTYKYSNRLFTAKWDHSFDNKNKAAVVFTNSQYKFNIEYLPVGTNAFDYGYKLNESQLLLNLKYLHNEKHSFNYGVSTKLYNIDPGHLNPSNPESTRIPINIQDEKALESAVYIADNYTINNKILLNFGLRYSYYAALGPSTQSIYQENAPINNTTVASTKTYANNEVIKTYGGFEPRVALRYLIKDDLSIKASYDKTFQYIHLLTSNTTQTPLDAWKLSDLNIKPQEAQQFSLGLFKNIKNDLLEISLEGYYKRSQNLLDYKVGGELVLKEEIETQLLQGEGKAYGIELLLRKQIGKLNGWLGYTYSRSFIKLDSEFNEEKVNNGEYFPTNFDKPHEVSAVLNYKLTKRYSVSSNFIYQSGRPITYPIGTYYFGNANYTLYSDRNKFRIPDYYRLDIGLNIEGNHKIKKLAHSFWNISIYNVLGRNNPYSIYFVTQEGKIKGYKTSIFAMPIPSITYNFKF